MSTTTREFPTPPKGYEAHQESTTQILIQSTNTRGKKNQQQEPEAAFINPVQEYNRDLSISVIRTWCKIKNDELEIKFNNNQIKKNKNNNNKNKRDSSVDNNNNNKKLKLNDSSGITSESVQQETPSTTTAITKEGEEEKEDKQKFKPHKFTLLEALSATGLRAIRYAKEIPSLKWVLANDLSPTAVNLIKLNITHNGLNKPSSTSTNSKNSNNQEEEEGRVHVNQGDACDLMYSHRSINKQFDIVDLDPYGSAAPFLDAAIQCVKDGGLLCVTCTDLAVLAGHAYPEKCFSNYGGSSIRAEYSHEYALRQVIHSLTITGARYGKFIKPILSLSIDFYVRIFVRVFNSPAQVKKLITNTALVYVCSGCSDYHFQPLGRSTLKPTKSSSSNNNNNNYQEIYHNSTGPPVTNGSECLECGSKFHIGGPIWSGPLHDKEFISKMLLDLNQFGNDFNTFNRINGMIQIAKTEISDSPFYFTPTKLSGLFKCTSPCLSLVGSSILNAGFQISRSHCSPGSIKTNAPRTFLYDLMKKWIGFNENKNNVDNKIQEQEIQGHVENSGKVQVENSENVEKENVEEEVKKDQVEEKEIKEEEEELNQQKPKHQNPTAVLLSKPPKYEIDLTYNKQVETSLMMNLKIVRYQSNPLPNWGPKSKALKK